MKIRETAYVRKALMQGEEVLVEGYLHWIHSVTAWCGMGIGGCLLIASVAAPVLAILGAICIGWGWYLRLKAICTQMLVTNRRVIFKEGIISTHTEELKNIKVESIEITQSIMGRILGYATIHFTGTGASDVYFHDVADPWVVKNAAEQAVEVE